MPVSIERQRFYPGGSLKSPEWLAIRGSILERENHACQRCHVPNGATIARGIGQDAGTFMYVDRLVKIEGGPTFFDRGIYLEDSGCFIDVGMDGFFEFEKQIKIVLTIAHLDHDPHNNQPDNLAALCQLHHNRHDARSRADRRRRRHTMDLFLDQGVAA